MRIIIEIEGDEVAVRTERMDRLRPADPGDQPPPEVLRAAAALGATSAGRAPSESEVAALGLAFRAEAVEQHAEPVDAGAAPFPPPGLAGDERERS